MVNDEKFNTRGLFVSYPYTEVLDVDKLKSNMNVTVDSKCKNIIYSLPNERKISIKSEILENMLQESNNQSSITYYVKNQNVADALNASVPASHAKGMKILNIDGTVTYYER